MCRALIQIFVIHWPHSPATMSHSFGNPWPAGWLAGMAPLKLPPLPTPTQHYGNGSGSEWIMLNLRSYCTIHHFIGALHLLESLSRRAAGPPTDLNMLGPVCTLSAFTWNIYRNDDVDWARESFNVKTLISSQGGGGRWRWESYGHFIRYYYFWEWKELEKR